MLAIYGFATGLVFFIVTASCWAAPLSLVIVAEHSEAAADCADEAKLFAKVEKISQRPLEPERPDPDAVRVVIRFDRSEDEYRADLEFQGPKPGERSLRDRSSHCEPLEDAVAVAIALLLDSEVERRERESREVARAVPTITIIRSEVVPKQLATHSFHVAGDAGIQGGFDSRAVPRFALALGMSPSDKWLFELSAELIPPATNRFGAGEVSVSLVAGALRACRLWGNEWQWGPCAGIGIGRLHGSGHGFDESLSSSLLWTAFSGGLLVQRTFADRWQLGAQATAAVPLREQRFSVQNLGTAWNCSAIWPSFGVRLGVRFR